MAFGYFWGNNFSSIFLESKLPTCFATNLYQVAPLDKVPSQKTLDIDPLTLKFSLKSECFIDNVNTKSVFSKTIFYVFQYRTNLKTSQIFRHLFEPCFSCVDIIPFLFRKKHFWENTDPRERSVLGMFC